MNSGPFIVYTDTNGIGWCRESEDGCPQYDGKRCLVTGFRPSGICEPWAIAAARRCEELEAIVRRVAVGLKAHRDPLSSEGRRIDHYDLSNAIANAVFDTAAEAAQKGGA